MVEKSKGERSWQRFLPIGTLAVFFFPYVIVSLVTDWDPLTAYLAVEGAEHVIMLGLFAAVALYSVAWYIRIKYF